MIGQLLAVLSRFEHRLTAEEVADTLWLAQQINTPAPDSPPASGAGEQPPAAAAATPPTQPAPTLRTTGPGQRGGRPEPWLPPPTRPARAALYAAADEEWSGGPSSTMAIRTPAVAALPDALSIARALRPLCQLADAAGVPRRLDEAATVQAAAQTRLWLPYLVPVQERWLDLAIVVDGGPSMVLWRQIVTELRKLMEELGAFRDIRLWQVVVGEPDQQPTLHPELGRATIARDPRELLDLSRRRLILVISDCIGRAWSSGTLPRWLDVWGRAGPVAILQPLPQRLWERCGAEFVPVRFAPAERGAANDSLHCTARLGAGDPPRGVPIPVLEIERRWLAPWASLVGGMAAGPVNGVALFTDAPPSQPADQAGSGDLAGIGPSARGDPLAEQRVRQFRATASPAARQLAEFLAAAPLVLPVMRLVQRLALPRSRPSDLAEVFLGDLLYQVTPADDGRHPEQFEYDFYPGVRELLLGGLLRSEALQIMHTVSEFVNDRMGAALDFPALLADTDAIPPLNAASRPFAEVMHTVLRAMGGRYAQLADRLGARLAESLSSQVGLSPDPAFVPSDLSGPAEALAAPPVVSAFPGADVTTQPRSETETPPPAQPIVWGNVPPRNPDFVGRQELLRSLRRQLTDRVTALLPHTLHGLGGVGKTQLAVEYVHQYRSSYELIWWIAAEQPALIRSTMAALAARLEVPAYEDVAQTLTAVYDALRTGRPYRRWLLVFDNANQPEDLAPFLSNPGGHVLITSRNREWSGVAETVDVDVFTRDESVALLRRRLPDITESEAEKLAEQLGDLPLALDAAANWQLATAMPIDEYMRLLDERMVQLLQESLPSTYPTPVAAAWGVAFDKLSQTAPASVQLLELCAFFGAEPISVKLLPMGRYAPLPAPLSGAVRDDIPLRRAVRDIQRYGLAKVNPTANSIQLHRLVQAVLRDRLTDEQRDAYRRSVHEILAAYNPGDPTDNPDESWSRHYDIAPHVQPSGAIDGATPDIRKVVLDQIRYQYVTGDYVSSRELGELAFRRWHTVLGPTDEQTLVAARFLGNALRSSGDPEGARALNDETFTLAKLALGDDHEHTLTTGNSVGADLRLIGDWKRARELDEELLARHRRVFGDDDSNTLRSANNLACDLRFLGDFEGARALDQEVLDRRRRVLESDHPDTYFTMTSLSRDLYGLGQYAEALKLQRESVPAHRAKIGEGHSNVLRATRIHIGTLVKMGAFEEACTMAQQMVAFSARNLGEKHLDTVGAKMTLAYALAAVDRLAEARVVGEDALAQYRATNGETHPLTLVCMTNLAIVLRAVGEYAAARDLDEQAVNGLRRRLGEEHPYAVNATTNYSNDFAAARDHPAARALLERNLEVARRTHGEHHPETLACAANLSLDRHASGDTASARELREETVTWYRRTLGPTHPETVAVVAGRRIFVVVDPPNP
jgi:hypothetical protein